MKQEVSILGIRKNDFEGLIINLADSVSRIAKQSIFRYFSCSNGKVKHLAYSVSQIKRRYDINPNFNYTEFGTIKIESNCYSTDEHSD